MWRVISTCHAEIAPPQRQSSSPRAKFHTDQALPTPNRFGTENYTRRYEQYQWATMNKGRLEAPGKIGGCGTDLVKGTLAA